MNVTYVLCFENTTCVCLYLKGKGEKSLKDSANELFVI